MYKQCNLPLPSLPSGQKWLFLGVCEAAARKLIQSVCSPFSARFRKSSANARFAGANDGSSRLCWQTSSTKLCSDKMQQWVFTPLPAVSHCSLRILSLPGAQVECDKSRFKQNSKQIVACESTSAENVPWDQWSRHRISSLHSNVKTE